MLKRFALAVVLPLMGGLVGCATPPSPVEKPVPEPPVSVPYVPAPATPVPEKARADKVEKKAVEAKLNAKTAEAKLNASMITIDCSVKLPDDPTDNPELCRSFQMEIVDNSGTETSHFRFGNDARFRFSGKIGKKYRIRPRIGKNWEFTVDPDGDLVVGESVRIQLRQKQ